MNMKLTRKEVQTFRDTARKYYVDGSAEKIFGLDDPFSVNNEDFVATCHIKAAYDMFVRLGMIKENLEDLKDPYVA